MKNRRTLIAAVLGGGLLLGAAGIGFVYFVVFAGSSPQKLALSSATPTTSASASSPASTAGGGNLAGGVGVAGRLSRPRAARLPPRPKRRRRSDHGGRRHADLGAGGNGVFR